jgi:hypothetical protein
MFLAFNRNKRSVTIDLAKEKGIDLARKLVDRADVVISSVSGRSIGTIREPITNLVLQLVPEDATRLGLTYKKLKGTNPGLIYLSVTGESSVRIARFQSAKLELPGYGLTGPYQNQISDGGVLAAETGITYWYVVIISVCIGSISPLSISGWVLQHRGTGS